MGDNYLRSLKKSADRANENVRLREKAVEVAKKNAFDEEVAAGKYRKFAEDEEKYLRDSFQSCYWETPEFREYRLATLKKSVDQLEERATSRKKQIEHAIKSLELAKVLAEQYRKTLDYFTTVKF